MHTSKLSKYIGILALILFLVSCEKKDSEDKIQGEYLYEYELLSSYTAKEVRDKLALVSFVYPELSELIATSEYGVDIYSVYYNTSINSEAIIASGIVCVPTSSLSFPAISFQNGTNTCHSNAPSENISNNFYSLISVMAGSGYVITIPDYIGFGQSEDILHPYHHKETSNAAIEDLLLAAEELIDSRIVTASLNNDLYLLGYSQGGWATMSVLKELEENPVGNFSVKAAACGAGAYDLMEMSKHVIALEEYGNPFYLPYFIESHRQNGFLNEPLTKYFNQPYADNIPDLFDGSLCNTEINEHFTNNMEELLAVGFIEGFETSADYASLRSELQNNSVQAWNLKAKLRMYHSEADNSVPSFLSDNLYNAFLNLGVSQNQIELELVDELEELDHNDAIIPWGTDALTWINSLESN